MSNVFFCPAALKTQLLILLQPPHVFCCCSLSLMQGTRAQLWRALGRQQCLNMFLAWEGILWASWLPHLGEAWVMKDGSCDDERGASFREAGAVSSLIPSTSIQMPFVWISCHLASRDFAARCSPSPLLKQEPNPLLTPPPAVKSSRATWWLRGVQDTVAGFFSYAQCVIGLWKQQWRSWSCSWFRQWVFSCHFPSHCWALTVCGSLC